MAHFIAEWILHFIMCVGFYAWGYTRGKKVNDMTIEDAIQKQIVFVSEQGTKVDVGDFQTILARDAQIKQLFDELDAMQHRVDELAEKVEQLVADMDDIARVFGAEGR